MYKKRLIFGYYIRISRKGGFYMSSQVRFLKAMFLGVAVGATIGASVTCALKPKKTPLRRKAEHALNTVGALMQSVADFAF